MTITYSLDHVSTSVEDVSVEVADKSNMTLQFSGPDPKNPAAYLAVYVIANGDNAFPSTVSYRVENQGRASGAIRRITCTFSTWATKSDDVTGEVVKKPLVASSAFNIPADMTIEVADMDGLIGNLFSFLYLSVTTKVRDTTWLAKLLYGIPQVK
jgi:hypothetical protein